MATPDSKSHYPITMAGFALMMASIMLNQMFFLEEISPPEKLLYFPGSDYQQGLALGYDRAVADIMWMNTIAYFGDHLETGQDYRHLAPMLDGVTQLNPKHEAAYYMAAVILPWMTDQLDDSEMLMIRAMNHLPENGRWAYYLGFNEYLFADNLETARHYLKRAISRGYINLLSASLAAKLEAKVGNLESAREFLVQSLSQKQENSMKHFLENELKAVETEIILRQIDSLVARTGIHPDDALHQLKTTWSDFPDTLPDDGMIIMGHDGKVRSSNRPLRFTLHTSRKRKQLLERSR